MKWKPWALPLRLLTARDCPKEIDCGCNFLDISRFAADGRQQVRGVFLGASITTRWQRAEIGMQEKGVTLDRYVYSR